MYNMIIVDDEYHIRFGLSNIGWDEMSINIEGVYSNGLEAYERISKGGIDIVLTDLKMPIMNGFELSQTINEEFYNISIIVLSGYNEFEYAKKLLEYNVFGYLLKPISIKELHTVVSRVKVHIDKQREQKNEIETLRQRSASSIKMFRKAFFKHLLERKMTFDEIEENSCCGEVILNSQNLMVAVFAFDDPINDESVSTIKVGVERVLTDIVNRESIGYFYVDDGFKYIYLIMSDVPKDGYREHVAAVLRRTKDALYSLKGITKSTLSCAVGNLLPIQEAYISASQAREALENLPRQNSIHFYEDYYNSKQKYGNNQLISAAQKYIHDNYNKSISLVDVAEHINVNNVYLSYLFKNVLGINFIVYITEYRIEKAKELLNNIRYRVNEVSALVGYDNSRYFSYVFKKHTGMTPGEYRCETPKELNGNVAL